MTTGRRRWALLLGLFLVSGVLMLVLWPDSPGDVVDFELAGDDGASEFLDAWTGWDGPPVIAVLLLDLPFLVAYGLGGALVLDAVAGWSTRRLPRWPRLLARRRRVAAAVKFALIYGVVPAVLLAALGRAAMAWERRSG